MGGRSVGRRRCHDPNHALHPILLLSPRCMPPASWWKITTAQGVERRGDVVPDDGYGGDAGEEHDHPGQNARRFRIGHNPNPHGDIRGEWLERATRIGTDADTRRLMWSRRSRLVVAAQCVLPRVIWVPRPTGAEPDLHQVPTARRLCRRAAASSVATRATVNLSFEAA